MSKFNKKIIKKLTHLMYKSSIYLPIKFLLELKTFDSLRVLLFHRQKWLDTRDKI